jgi:ribose 5-phosphate isomerase RpiB
MFFTARQLEQLHRESGKNGHLVLPYRARLTPAAQDWVRLKKIALGYADDTNAAPFSVRPQGGMANGAGMTNGASAATGAGASNALASSNASGPSANAPLLWWCDGPCGAAKAAITGQAKESLLRALELPADPKQIVPVIKAIAADLKSGNADAALLVVQNAAGTMVFANRCPSIRAVVGTCLEAVEQGIQQIGANVLVIEHAYKTFPQIKTMLARFARAKREVNPDVLRQLAELASCG